MKVIRHISGCIALVMILLAGSALHLSAQPSNDMPCSAVELEISDSCDFSEYTNIDASDSGLPDPGCAFYAGGDIWFLVIVPADSSFEIQTDTEAEAQFPLNNGWMFRGAMALYEGSCDTLTPMGCYENNSSYHPRMAGAVLSGQNPGDTIWVRIWENSNNDNGKLNICVTPLVEVEEACPGVFDVSGGGSYCQGDTGVSVTLPGSEPGMQYTLLLNDTVRMDTLAGNGSSLAWSPVTGVGIYKIEGENPADSCIIMMNDSALVTVLAVPQLTPDEVSITCFEDDDGSISLEVIAEPPFVVEWTGPSGYLSNKQNLTD
ncbi:MAG: hypothetical protein KAT15_25670, partial [Bacteroidales bacterium]|nr:hypothetical protein [Bacteroidales bacterium]